MLGKYHKLSCNGGVNIASEGVVTRRHAEALKRNYLFKRSKMRNKAKEIFFSKELSVVRIQICDVHNTKLL